jgi:hypothetical protein
MNAHAKIRVSIELGFSGCMAEARSILRDAVEFVAHAHRVMGDTALQKLWLGKDEDEKAWNEEFLHTKKEKLFKGLDELHRKWGELSERGSHANILGLVGRFHIVESDKHIDWQLHYCGGEDERSWALEMFTLLLTCFTMEDVFFRDFQGRLILDDRLRLKRNAFQSSKEELRAKWKSRFNVQLTPIV